MRVIAGKNKGKKLIGPKTESIRPTLDRVKEPLFSILSNRLEDAIFLDLFGGTGAISIEALSRGSKFVWINDISKDAIKIISSNLSLTQSQNCAKITRKEYDKCLDQISKENIKFNIIFLDPPYDTNYEENILKKIVEYDILDDKGCIILESDKRKVFNEDVNHLILKDKRIYGRVILRIYVKEDK